jgi:hypothetical protein
VFFNKDISYERAHRYNILKSRKSTPVSLRKGIGGVESLKEVIKGVWGMPRLSEAKKDVISCDKLRGFANRN